jgi:NADH:ubiquinone oxidoreductase subunit 3 (subunit A)
MLREYGVFLVFFAFALLISFVVFGISFFGVLKQYDLEKISAYECGFDPFEDTRKRFDVRFYLVAILFIVFDLEVAYLFPWSLVLGSVDVFGYFVMMIFLSLVTLGFVYEWLIGALDWE